MSKQASWQPGFSEASHTADQRCLVQSSQAKQALTFPALAAARGLQQSGGRWRQRLCRQVLCKMRTLHRLWVCKHGYSCCYEPLLLLVLSLLLYG